MFLELFFQQGPAFEKVGYEARIHIEKKPEFSRQMNRIEVLNALAFLSKMFTFLKYGWPNISTLNVWNGANNGDAWCQWSQWHAWTYMANGCKWYVQWCVFECENVYLDNVQVNIADLEKRGYIESVYIRLKIRTNAVDVWFVLTHIFGNRLRNHMYFSTRIWQFYLSTDMRALFARLLTHFLLSNVSPPKVCTRTKCQKYSPANYAINPTLKQTLYRHVWTAARKTEKGNTTKTQLKTTALQNVNMLNNSGARRAPTFFSNHFSPVSV